MKQIKLITIRIFVILTVALSFPALALVHEPGITTTSQSLQIEVNLKDKALLILQNKCNVCHKTRNPRRIFTSGNMEESALKIYKQVFVKKRMPKGNKIQLTDKEYDTLKRWLNSLNIYS